MNMYSNNTLSRYSKVQISVKVRHYRLNQHLEV